MLEIQVDFTVEGRKTSEGDGRTAADIEREMEKVRREAEAFLRNEARETRDMTEEVR